SNAVYPDLSLHLSRPIPASQAQVPRDRRGTQRTTSTMNLSSSNSDSVSVSYDGRATHNYLASPAAPASFNADGLGKEIWTGARGEVVVDDEIWTEEAKMQGRRRANTVKLEHLVLNLEKLRPVLDVVRRERRRGALE